MEEKTGTRFGGFGDLIAKASTSRIVSRDGWTPSYRTRSVDESRRRTEHLTCEAMTADNQLQGQYWQRISGPRLMRRGSEGCWMYRGTVTRD
jgi:hypothetical protein